MLGAGSRQRPGMVLSILQTPRQRWPGPKVSAEAEKPRLASVPHLCILIYQEVCDSGPVHPCVIQDRQADKARSPSFTWMSPSFTWMSPGLLEVTWASKEFEGGCACLCVCVCVFRVLACSGFIQTNLSRLPPSSPN